MWTPVVNLLTLALVFVAIRSFGPGGRLEVKNPSRLPVFKGIACYFYDQACFYQSHIMILCNHAVGTHK